MDVLNYDKALKYEEKLVHSRDRSAVTALNCAKVNCSPLLEFDAPNLPFGKFESSCPVDLLALYKAAVATFDESSEGELVQQSDSMINEAEADEIIGSVSDPIIRKLAKSFSSNVSRYSQRFQKTDAQYCAKLFLTMVQSSTDIDNILSGEIFRQSAKLTNPDCW